MFDRSLGLLRTDIGIGVCGCLIANQHGVALAVITGALRSWAHLNQAPVAVAGTASADAFAHNRGAGTRPHMNHFCSRVRLLAVVGQSNGIKLSNGIGPLQHATWILPSNG